MNISNHILRHSRLSPEKPALVYGHQVYSYALLNVLVNRAANALRALPLARGDRVALYLPNCPAFLIGYLATVRIGAICVSINAMLKREEVYHILADSGARALLTTGELLPQVPQDLLPELRHVIICSGQPAGYQTLDQLLERADTRAVPADLHRDDPAVILYTSGTTGLPKGATLSHGNVISNCYSVVHHSGLTPYDRLMLFLPLFHVFGQNHIMNSCFTAGATLLLHQRFELEPIMAALRREQATCLFGVPTVFIYLLGMERQLAELHTLRYCFTASASMPMEIARRWQEQTGLQPHEGYGLTECSPCASYNHEICPKLGSIGEPVENVEMKIVDPHGHELPAGAWGEIIIRGPGVMLGYWNQPAQTAEALRGGWLHSGDIGTIDDEGYFYVVDRIKDLINVAGFKVYPSEVEQVLYRHQAVKEVAVYGLPDPIKGERVVADVVLKPGACCAPQELIQFVRSQIAVYKAPREVHMVTALPKNATGKVLKRSLRELAIGAPQQSLTRHRPNE